jgi:hypothetical protein
MGIFNWISNNKKDNRAASNSGKITVEKALDFAKTYEELKPFFALFIHFFKYLLNSEKEIGVKVKDIQSKTQQNLKEEQLSRELWILRYVCLHVWFFDLKQPKNQTELSDGLLVINSALKNVLQDRNKLDYLPWLKKGFSEFTNVDELNFKSLKTFKEDFSNKLAEKIPHIAFECTEGRLGGELHDFVIELIMTTIQRDQKVFSMNDEDTLTEEETTNIKNAITEMSGARHEAAGDFINSLK